MLVIRKGLVKYPPWQECFQNDGIKKCNSEENIFLIAYLLQYLGLEN